METLPDWLMIKVLPIAIMILGMLWYIRYLRRDLKRTKEQGEKEREEHKKFMNIMLRHRD